MSDGLATTFRILSETDNETAVHVLLPALDSPIQSIQEGALVALLTRRRQEGQGEILRRIPSMSTQWKCIINRHSERLTGTLRDALLGSDEILFKNACQAAVMFRDYDLIPTLLTVIEDPSKSKVEMAIDTLMQLIVQLEEDGVGPLENARQRDPHWIRQHAISCLETSVQRFGKHKRREVIEALLMLADSDNEALMQIMQNPHHASFLFFIDMLARSSRDGVIRLLLSYLDDAQVPSAVLSVIGNRSDLKFIRNFLRKIGRDPSAIVKDNLKRIDTIPWLQHKENVIGHLEEGSQLSLVQLVTSAGISRAQVFSTIECILLNGKPMGRREAARALTAFNGADANSLALEALDDPDSQVQAIVVEQLRRRGIPGIMPRLVGMLDSPHVEVRQAARQSLSEYSFSRLLSTFDMLDDDVRQTTAVLVKKIDQQTIPLLSGELKSSIHSRRIRGLQIARAMDIVEQIEDLVIGLLQDEDHFLRAEAATTLAKSNSTASRVALEETLLDSSQAVQEAAQRSLQERLQNQNNNVKS
jgi:hypothetical protein